MLYADGMLLDKKLARQKMFDYMSVDTEKSAVKLCECFSASRWLQTKTLNLLRGVLQQWHVQSYALEII